MKKRLLGGFALIAYIALLIKVMVFKDIPTIRIGQLMLNFGGTESGHPANFVPFRTIVPYLLGYKGWIIAGINLVGNIALLVPLGFLLPFVCRSITWKKSLAIAIAAGLSIETLQTVLHVGIFDIDDVILNALGVMIGYFAFLVLAKWLSSRSYMKILGAAVVVIAAAAGAFYFVYPWGKPLINSGAGAYGQIDTGGTGQEGEIPHNGDLCGGTGGIGVITGTGNASFTITQKDGKSLNVDLTDRTTIRTSAGPATESDLKAGDRVTLVGDPNPDGSFAAQTVLVCSKSDSDSH